MAEPIKTQVLAALAATLADLEELGSVRSWEEIPADLSSIPAAELPALFIWEEEDPDLRNRLAWNTLHIHLQVYFSLPPPDYFAPADGPPLTAFNQQADALAARLHNVLAQPSRLRTAGAIQVMLDGTRAKGLATPELGQLVFPLTIVYGHAAGDACSLTY